ncbi:hypothetical protein LTR22_015310 [Elasticomyces elasticus]|nr:hypothetical protein LTR22_015310 [Elasticomyces elasticus]
MGNSNEVNTPLPNGQEPADYGLEPSSSSVIPLSSSAMPMGSGVNPRSTITNPRSGGDRLSRSDRNRVNGLNELDTMPDSNGNTRHHSQRNSFLEGRSLQQLPRVILPVPPTVADAQLVDEQNRNADSNHNVNSGQPSKLSPTNVILPGSNENDKSGTKKPRGTACYPCKFLRLTINREWKCNCKRPCHGCYAVTDTAAEAMELCTNDHPIDERGIEELMKQLKATAAVANEFHASHRKHTVKPPSTLTTAEVQRHGDKGSNDGHFQTTSSNNRYDKSRDNVCFPCKKKKRDRIGGEPCDGRRPCANCIRATRTDAEAEKRCTTDRPQNGADEIAGSDDPLEIRSKRKRHDDFEGNDTVTPATKRTYLSYDENLAVGSDHGFADSRKRDNYRPGRYDGRMQTTLGHNDERQSRKSQRNRFSDNQRSMNAGRGYTKSDKRKEYPTGDGLAKPKKSPDYSKPCHFFNTAVCTKPDCQFQHRKYQLGDAGYRGPSQKAGNAQERDGTDDEFFDAEDGLDSEEEHDETG